MDTTATAVRSLTSADVRDPSRTGRSARLEMTFAVRNGRTVLAHAYAEPPFRVGRCFVEGDGLHGIVAHVAPGLFGGDRFHQRITVERGARVRLTSQSAMQVHPASDGSPATLMSTYHVAENARLQCHWDPVIPFERAALDQRINIDLAGSARLDWSDAVMSGRDACGERWQFSRLAHELRVSRSGSLAYLERYEIEPANRRVDARWIGGNASHFGTVLVAGSHVRNEDAERLHKRLEQISELQAAADLLEQDLLLVRLTASSGVAFREARGLFDWADQRERRSEAVADAGAEAADRSAVLAHEP